MSDDQAILHNHVYSVIPNKQLRTFPRWEMVRVEDKGFGHFYLFVYNSAHIPKSNVSQDHFESVALFFPNPDLVNPGLFLPGFFYSVQTTYKLLSHRIPTVTACPVLMTTLLLYTRLVDPQLGL